MDTLGGKVVKHCKTTMGFVGESPASDADASSEVLFATSWGYTLGVAPSY